MKTLKVTDWQARAAAIEAANSAAWAAGRVAWNADDNAVARETFNKLAPKLERQLRKKLKASPRMPDVCSV